MYSYTIHRFIGMTKSINITPQSFRFYNMSSFIQLFNSITNTNSIYQNNKILFEAYIHLYLYVYSYSR